MVLALILYQDKKSGSPMLTLLTCSSFYFGFNEPYSIGFPRDERTNPTWTLLTCSNDYTSQKAHC